MNKIEIINKIRNKLFGNIGNKQWFKNYKCKKMAFKNTEDFILSGLSSYLLTISILCMNETLLNLVKELNVFFEFILNNRFSFVINYINSFFFMEN